ncbi:MAG: UDP-2,3-diacylglucosamine hydrolase [Chitinophagaceae bacterium]|nr:MAG: UDP-2,3-diacylglucosamine hydrolase [Chitinophagaceae bacterium]
MRREADVIVLSDLHLGTYGCHAMELVDYIRSIQPKILILNGDIIDIWQFRKHYFPAAHMQVIKEIFSLMAKGTQVVYITGNHDESLRRYSGLQMGNLLLTDKYVMDLDGEKTWIFHGDVFDATTKGSAKMIAKLGGQGYDMLILLNRAINWLLKMVGKEKMSLSKKVKNSVKKAVSWISNFEQIAAELAIEKKYKNVICGHIHQPQIKEVKTEKGSVTYMNSGDWIENLTSLEYNQGKWEIFQYEEKEITKADISVFKKENKIPILDILTDEVAVFFNSMTATIQ